MPRMPFVFTKKPKIVACATAVGALEAKGPLSSLFDVVSDDSKYGMNTWEKAEAEMVRSCTEIALKKAKMSYQDVDVAFAGDLTNQCASTTFGMKDKGMPYIGLYGACSTFALSLGMAALSIESGLATTTLSVASSHFCSAERQYRFPLEYGCQRTPTAQTTVTGAGSVILKNVENKDSAFVAEFFPGIVRDLGIKDANNMGAAMAPACADTVCRYFSLSNCTPKDFDLILTGDLGLEGHRIFLELCGAQGLNLVDISDDCGKIIYNMKEQDVNSGGSGCGCSAAVFSSLIMDQFQSGHLRDILLIGTGALLNSTTVLQKETIPGIAHLVRIRKDAQWN